MNESNEFDNILMDIDAQIDIEFEVQTSKMNNNNKFFESKCKCILGKVCSGCIFLCNCYERTKNKSQNDLNEESTICDFDSMYNMDNIDSTDSVDSLECLNDDEMTIANNSDNSDNYSETSIIIDESDCLANITYCDIFSEYVFTHITKHDMDTMIASINYMKSIDIELQNLYNFKKYNCVESDFCLCCINYTVIHYSCIRSFISKYIYDDVFDNENKFEEKKNVIISNSFYPKPSSKLIKILYRLHPDFFDEFDIDKIKALKHINKSCIKSADSYEHIFQNYFYSENDMILKNEYESCSICLNRMCPKHLSFNDYHRSNCKHCAKKWNICPWCLESKLCKLYNPLYNKLLYSHSLCNIFHKNT
mgnify:CR=1 FL=1